MERNPNSQLDEVVLPTATLDRFRDIVGDARYAAAFEAAVRTREALASRVLWNVNSTAFGGGVAEMLRALLPYVRGVGIDTRWVVIRGDAEFFHTTKRIHHALHGDPGDGSPLDDKARSHYEAVSVANANELLARVRTGDVVILHDPQTAGLAEPLRRAGATVIWRCHIGADTQDAETELGWRFLQPFLVSCAGYVFTRARYVPAFLPRERCLIVPPSIDPFAPKNQDLDSRTVRGILSCIGVIAPPPDAGTPTFRRTDGSPGRVDRGADIVRHGPVPSADTPLVAQVSRWDRLKDPAGVLHGFVRMTLEGQRRETQLVLAGPNVRAVADDPDGAPVFEEVAAAWRALPHDCRRRVQLVSLPTADVDENAAMVNAIQRHAAVVVQKSLHEGFGLTVAEAMWKGKAVVASAVGGICDQIQDGIDGLLVRDPTDLDEFAATLRRLLDDPDLAERIGRAARETVRARYLGLRHLEQYASLVSALVHGAKTPESVVPTRSAPTRRSEGKSADAAPHAGTVVPQRR